MMCLTWCFACRLTSLRTLSLQSNRLTSMVGFGQCIHLEELYLSHNGISRLEVCTSAPEVSVRDVGAPYSTALLSSSVIGRHCL